MSSPSYWRTPPSSLLLSTHSTLLLLYVGRVSGVACSSVANEAGIINAEFFHHAALFAVLTFQAAGAWLAHVLRTGRPLLTGVAEPTPALASQESRKAA